MSFDADPKAEAEARRAERALRAQFRRDVQTVFGTAEGRRVLWAFLDAAGYDVSAYRAEPAAMAHAVGWQDAAGWWINQLRRHCPEREAQMRKEAAHDAPQDESDD